ncbi:hypothetical protein PO909_023623 [Leuciscus waleckii]
MLPQRLTFNCIVMCGDIGNIHFEGGGRQPSLQPILQEGKHDTDRAFSGVFSARRAPGDEEIPLQHIGVSHGQGSSRSDGSHHRRWVPEGAPSLRKEVLSQRNWLGRCCCEEYDFGVSSPVGPMRRKQKDLLLVLPDLAQELCKKAHWGKRILAEAPQPAVRQCIRAEGRVLHGSIFGDPPPPVPAKFSTRSDPSPVIISKFNPHPPRPVNIWPVTRPVPAINHTGDAFM